MAFSRFSLIRHWDNPFAQWRKMLKSLKEIAHDARKTTGTDVRSPTQRQESRRITTRVRFVRLPLASGEQEYAGDGVGTTAPENEKASVDDTGPGRMERQVIIARIETAQSSRMMSTRLLPAFFQVVGSQVPPRKGRDTSSVL